jgi:ABC-type phosphonate transport system ATPase subunit
MASASGAEMTTPLLEAKAVSKTFGPVHALRDVDFEVTAGEVVALVGDNGTDLGIATVCTRTLRSATTSTWWPTSSSARRRSRTGREP